MSSVLISGCYVSLCEQEFLMILSHLSLNHVSSCSLSSYVSFVFLSHLSTTCHVPFTVIFVPFLSSSLIYYSVAYSLIFHSPPSVVCFSMFPSFCLSFPFPLLILLCSISLQISHVFFCLLSPSLPDVLYTIRCLQTHLSMALLIPMISDVFTSENSRFSYFLPVNFTCFFFSI